jgi:hypothetical protein
MIQQGIRWAAGIPRVDCNLNRWLLWCGWVVGGGHNGCATLKFHSIDEFTPFADGVDAQMGA